MTAGVRSESAQLAVHASLDDARRAAGWLAGVARMARVPEGELHRLDHCLDEALANIVAHGGPAAQATPIRLTFDVARTAGQGVAAVTVSDTGAPFDPCSIVVDGTGVAGLDDVQPGGLGLTMIRAFADELRYCRSDGRNHLTFAVRWDEVRA